MVILTAFLRLQEVCCLLCLIPGANWLPFRLSNSFLKSRRLLGLDWNLSCHSSLQYFWVLESFFFWSLIRFACVRSLCSQNLVGSLVYIPTNRPNLKLRHSVSICEQLMNLEMYVSRGGVQESKLPSRLSEGIYSYRYGYYLPTHPLDDLRSIESFSSCIVWCKLSSCSCVSHNLDSLMWLLSQFPSIWRATHLCFWERNGTDKCFPLMIPFCLRNFVWTQIYRFI